MSPEPTLPPALARRVCGGCGLFALAGGAASLLGWATDTPRLTDWFGNGISMQPNTAAAAMVAGAALLLLALGHRTVGALLGVVVSLVGAATLFEHLSGFDLGIDTLLFDRPWGRGATTSPGRMGPPASTSFTLIGIGIALASGAIGGRTRRIAVVCGVAASAIALHALIGYLFGADALYAVARWSGIALQTTTILIGLGVGVVAAIPERQPTRALLEDSAAGVLVRRALPFVVALPAFLGWLLVAAQDEGHVDAGMGTALLVLALIVLMCAVLWWSVAAVTAYERSLAAMHEAKTRADHGLHVAEEGLRRSEQRLEAELRGMTRLHDAGLRFSRAPDLQSLANEILAVALDLLRAERGLLRFAGAARDRLAVAATQGLSPRLADAMSAADVAMRSTPTRHQTRCVEVEDVPIELGMPRPDVALLLDEGVRAVLVSPLYGRDGHLLAVLYVFMAGAEQAPGAPAGPSETDLRFLELLERMATDSIERCLSSMALSDADRRKGEFLALLAHELRNPLAVVTNSLEVLGRAGGAADAADVVEQIRATMNRQVAQMVRLIDDLFDVSRITRDKLELRRVAVDLRAIARDAVEGSRPTVEAAGQRLELLIPDQPVYVEGDPLRLAQVLGNLLSNASRYSDPGGRIWLVVERMEGDAVIRVKDEGAGIPPEMLSSVFDMFFQVDRASQSSQSGLGIGLTLVKQLVELLDGTVTATSEGEGRGSEFVVKFPALVEPPADSSAQPTGRPPVAGTRRRVLVVDDNPDSVDTLATWLTLTRSEVQTALDGYEAVARAETFRPDAILLDIGMPGMDGYDVCRSIRGLPWGRQVVVIALTGWGLEEDRRKSAEAGFDAHLVKPVDHTALLELLDRLEGEKRKGAEA